MGMVETIVSVNLGLRIRVNSGYMMGAVKITNEFSQMSPSYTTLEQNFPSQAEKDQWLDRLYDVTSLFDTEAKINDAAIWLYHDVSGGTGIYIDHAFLSVQTNLRTYTLNVAVEESRENWVATGTSPYLDAQDYPTNYISNHPNYLTSDAYYSFQKWT